MKNDRIVLFCFSLYYFIYFIFYIRKKSDFAESSKI